MPASKGNVRKRPSGSWQANWLDAHGVRRFKSFQYKKDADTYLRQILGDVDLVRVGLPERMGAARGRHKWSELVELWETKKAAKISLKDDQSRIRVHLAPLLEREVVESIHGPVVTAVERALHKKVQAGQIGVSSQRKILVQLQAMLRMAAREKWIVSAPVLELPREPLHDRPWVQGEEEIVKLLEAATARGYPGLRELYATAIATGLRKGELMGLDWDAVDFRNRVITVRRTSVKGPEKVRTATKGAKVRHVPIPDDLMDMLREFKLSGLHPTIVFPNKRGGRQGVDGRVFDDIFKECARTAGIPDGLTFHGLRHTYGSHYVQRGGNVYTLQKVMGHESVNTTQLYAHLSEDAFGKDRQMMSGMLGRRKKSKSAG